MRDNGRYLLCRPRGGLSDSLSLIERCRLYCESTGRTLVVDGVRSNFARDFSKVFEVIDDSAVRLAPDRGQLRMFDSMTCRPAEVSGRLRTYEVNVYTKDGMNPLEWRMPLDSRSGVVLQVPLSVEPVQQFSEDVLLVEAHAGGDLGVDFLGRCRVVPRVARRIRARLASIAERGYVGIHVRNSDLRSNWREFLRDQETALAGRMVVVCSDDAEVLRSAATMLGRSRVVTPSRVPTTGGVPYQASFVRRRLHRKLAIDTLTDLLALAGADEVLCPPVVNRNDPSSSFTRLARAVGQTPGLCEQLLSG